jgi:Zn ribbon nucleic-acid-binding protein
VADFAQGLACPHCATLTALSAHRGDTMLTGTCASCGSQFARPLNHFFPGQAARDPSADELAAANLIGQRTVSTAAPVQPPAWAYPPRPVDPDPLFDDEEDQPPAAVVSQPPPSPPFVPATLAASAPVAQAPMPAPVFDPFEESPSPLGDPPAPSEDAKAAS